MQMDPQCDGLHLALAQHGGNLAAAQMLFPNAPGPWLDLSTGINPYAYPFSEVPRQLYASLPGPGALAALERQAARVFGVEDAATVVAAAGSQAFIQWLPVLLAAKKIGILGLTYNEYGRVFERSGAKVLACDDFAALARMDAAVIVNPNNPDGRFCEPHELLQLASQMAARGAILIVDEAFIDMQESRGSGARLLPGAGGGVLRSFGKAYGLAGIRLGFAVLPKMLASRMRDLLGPWPVSAPAIAIGLEALSDFEWLPRVRHMLANDVILLDKMLAAAEFSSVGGTLSFRLVRHANAGQRFSRLGEAGILVRPFAGRPDLLRFGIARGERDLLRLHKALFNNDF